MQIHKTKGIVLRAIKYGETSIIASVYTELFGLQSYIIKGVRQSSKKASGKSTYFQPAALLDMEVYHNEMKQLQFVKDFQWSYLYETVFFDVIRNAVAMYIVEMVQHSLKQPEANPELFYLIDDTLKQVDKGNNALVSNLPVYFTLHLAAELGFQIQGTYSSATPFLDLQDGNFVKHPPQHSYYIEGSLAKWIYQINTIQFYNDLENIHLNGEQRRQLVFYLQQYIALHIQDFGELRSIAVLQAVLS